MVTPAEMYNRLNNLKKRINNKKKEVNAFRNEYTRARFPPVLINKHPWVAAAGVTAPQKVTANTANHLTPQMWSNFVFRGAKLVYNQYNPLVQKYMNLSKQYRNAIGLKPLNNVYRNKEQISFVIKKPSGTIRLRNILRNSNLNNKIGEYKMHEIPYGIQISNGFDERFIYTAATAYALPFIEDKELLKILRNARNKRNIAILKGLNNKNLGPLILRYVRKPSN